ncbi:MAG TPA: glycoside hydrolase 43 family protein [Gemmatimonadaceae bacterium]|nr:glycoside hydrolase 43 family protein [Gemmatimonadaceae bacterium]
MLTRPLQATAILRLGLLTIPLACQGALAQTWSADNGNGTYSNPLFYDEFSDPDLIRVGSDYYLTGTTMHAMPGLPLLHSRDLVNWSLLGYAFDRLDLGPGFRLEDGQQIYGQGIWAPSLRYRNGVFHIFTNINGRKTQLFRATNPRGPWTRTEMKRSFHDLSVLFDDDGRAYVVWGYRNLHFAELDTSLTDIVPGSERELFGKDALMGEGVHFYKMRGKYYLLSAWYAGRMRMPCARAERPEGPYEVNVAISADEDFGITKGYRLRSDSTVPMQFSPPDPTSRGGISMHQGGIVQTPTGEWWGFSMMDANSVGRLTALSPVTWHDGWPYFGLPGNLGRTPRIWVKPRTGSVSRVTAPYARNDDFGGVSLANVWQWNHVPDDARWSLAERPGYLRLHSLPAPDLWWARNTLTQRAVGPRSSPVTILETAGMREGDVAGLALLNRPYAWIGVRRDSTGAFVEQFDQTTGQVARHPLAATRVWLRADCDFLTEKATFSYSTDGRRFESLGDEFTMVFQLKTFQGVRYSLFAFHAGQTPGGFADFDAMTVSEPSPRGLTRAIPVGRIVTFTTAVGGRSLDIGGATAFTVIDRGLGRIALRTPSGFVSVAADSSKSLMLVRRAVPSIAETFQWIETPYGDVSLLSLATSRYVRLNSDAGTIAANHQGPEPGRADGAQFGLDVTGIVPAGKPSRR